MAKREKFPTRRILIKGELQRQTAIAAVQNAPIDPDRPIEFILREEVKARKLDQNSLMWVGPLSDISEQAYLNGRTFSRKCWHHYFKCEFLPEENDPDLHELVKDPQTYKKWDYTPSGERVLVGSTGDLTIKGFSQYLTQVEAFGASLGVMFHANPKERKAA